LRLFFVTEQAGDNGMQESRSLADPETDPITLLPGLLVGTSGA
jgi:hypothetical protein